MAVIGLKGKSDMSCEHKGKTPNQSCTICWVRLQATIEAKEQTLQMYEESIEELMIKLEAATSLIKLVQDTSGGKNCLWCRLDGQGICSFHIALAEYNKIPCENFEEPIC